MIIKPLTNRAVCVLTGAAIALGTQFAVGQSRNNPYSPSPDKRSTPASQNARPPVTNDGVTFRLASDTTGSRRIDEPVTIAETTFKIAKAAAAKSLAPTETYKIGAGDVLFVSLKNSPNGSGYFTVRPDGTIDYPLAGENVLVVDQTIDMAEDIVAGGIKLFNSPVVQIKVRQYASHKISVAGSVENAGEKSLQREAMPLFAIRAEAVPNAKATQLRIRRAGTAGDQLFDLHDTKTDETLIYPGDQLHFYGDAVGAGSSYFIGGEIASAGQKDLTAGLTLYQAIVASGGAKGDPKKAVIRRKDDKGMLSSIEHNLRNIKGGKAMDPILAPGDVIEVRN